MSQRVKVAFKLGESHDAGVETMYAVLRDDGRFVLDNSPFYVYGISFCDVFNAYKEDGRYVFKDVFKHGGHSTYRLKLPVRCDHDDFLKAWKELELLGCSYEGSDQGKSRLYSIDVPPEANVTAIYNYLQKMEDMGVWEFEEAHYSGLGQT